MEKKSLTKKDTEVLYQIDSGIFDPVRIADILPHLDLKDVRETLADLRKKGLVKGRKGELLLTEKGREALESHRKWIFG